MEQNLQLRFDPFVLSDEVKKDSDIDILVVVDDSLDPLDVRKSLSDLLFDILLEEDELVSVIPVSEQFFNTYNSPFR